jgi:hypothetical protein
MEVICRKKIEHHLRKVQVITAPNPTRAAINLTLPEGL